MITREQIYNRVVKEIKKEHEVRCVSKREYTPASFPCLWIEETIDEPIAMNFDGTCGARNSTFELQCFSSLNAKEAKEIIDFAVIQFQSIGYRCEDRRPMDNEDVTVYRHVARLKRVIGSEDVLPE